MSRTASVECAIASPSAELCGSEKPGPSFILEDTPQGLVLRARHRPDWEPLLIDWSAPDVLRRVQAGRRQLMPRALGLHKKPGLRIVDATAGLGRDGFTLAALGASVTLIERNSLIGALLRDARRRARDCAWPAVKAAAQRIEIVEGDSTAWFATRQGSGADAGFDAVHLDPMYPEDGKTALPQKAMQMLRDLTGGDADADALLDAAIASGVRRIAVKRQARAAPLGRRQPDLTVSGTQARYDIYLNTGLSQPTACSR